MRRALLGTGLLIALLAAAAWTWRAPLIMAVGQRVAAQRLATDALRALPDGLHAGLCGAGSPFPDEHRAGPCTLVVAGPHLLVFDAGSGSARNIARMGFNHGAIEAIFLTHFHSDHFDGLGELLLQRWVAGANTAPVPLYGPPGVEQLAAGLMQAYGQDRGYRVAHHGVATIPPGGFGAAPLPFTAPANGAVVVLRQGDLEVVAFNVDHTPVHPAVGYRIRYKDRSVVLSGDTKASGAVEREAKGADLLVHEALSEPLVRALQDGARTAGRQNLVKVFGDIIDYHSSPEDAARTAQRAGVRMLLLNHIAPPLPVPGMEGVFLGQAADIYTTGPLRVGADGDFVSLPAGGTRVELSRRF